MRRRASSLNLSEILGLIALLFMLFPQYSHAAHVTGISISPGSLVGGSTQIVSGTVTIERDPPFTDQYGNVYSDNGAQDVSLGCSSDCVVYRPYDAYVPAGATSGTFEVTAPVVVDGSVTNTITAYLGETVASTTVTVTPLITSFSISPSSLVGGSTQIATGTVQFAAPPFSRIFSVGCSSDCIVFRPYDAYIAPGATSATFEISAPVLVDNPVTSTITVSLDSQGLSAAVTVTPLITLFSISPSSLVGGSAQTATGTVQFAAPPFSKLFSVGCSSPCTAVVPSGARIPDGATTATFEIAAGGVVNSPSPNTITVSLDSQALSATVEVDPFLPKLAMNPSSLTSGDSGTGSVSLNAAPISDTMVSLSVSPPSVLSVPESVIVPAGTSTSPAFAFTASDVPAPTKATVTATLNGNSDTANVKVTPKEIKDKTTDTDTCPSCPDPLGQSITEVGLPINIANGNTWITQTDYTIPGLGGGFGLQRTWSSLWPISGASEAVGLFGDSWRSTLEERLEVVSQTSLTYWRSDGSQWSYALLNGNWSQQTPKNEQASLSFDSSTTLFTLSWPDGSREIFDNSGYLSQKVDRNNRQTTLTYDSQHRVSQVTDPANRTVTLNYASDASRQVASIQDSVGIIATYNYTGTLLSQVTCADGSGYTYSYDTNNLITSVNDNKGAVLETHTYDASRRGLTSAKANGAAAVSVSYGDQATTVTDSNSNTSTFQYSTIAGRKFVTSFSGSGCATCAASSGLTRTYDQATGNLLQQTDALGHVSTYTFDGNNNILTKSFQLDNGTFATWSYTYNQFSEVLTATDPLGNVTTNTYDGNGNLLSVTAPAPNGTTASSVTQFSYDSQNQLIQITDPLGGITKLAYTPAGLVKSITDAQGNVTTYQYDARGNRTAIVNDSGTTTLSYDAANHLTGIIYPDSTTASFGYDNRGRRTSATDQNSHTTGYTYDDADHLTAVTDAAGKSTQYAYDSENNLLSITDASGNATTFTYGPNRWVTQTTFPSKLTETYTYDALGNLTGKTDRKGQTISYGYDALNRLTSKSYPDSSSTSYTYDLAGKLLTVNDATGTYGFSYDNMGRLTGTTTSYTVLSGQTLSNTYSYDAASNRTGSTTADGGSNAYQYDTLNRLTSLNNSWAGQFGFSYDSLSRRTQLTRPNGVNSSYGYDSLSRLLNVLHGSSDGARYGYDGAGNRTSKQNLRNSVTENYGYDALYQLTSVLQGSNTSESYSYDAVGNRLSSLGLNPYSFNVSNQLVSLPSTTFSYDSNGNMLTKAASSGTATYAWDFENRLASASVPQDDGTIATATFKYDPFGRRILKTSSSGTTIYAYDGSNVVAEYSGAGVLVASYTQGAGIDEPLAMKRAGSTVYYHADGLGSITSLTSAGGTVVASYVYSSFGKTTPTEGIFNPYRYTAREQDPETGLYYYRARYYDPSIGRFLSEDPIQFLGGVNFYAYVNNNPANLIDPFGLCDDKNKKCRENFLRNNYGNFVADKLVPNFSGVSLFTNTKEYLWGAGETVMVKGPLIYGPQGMSWIYKTTGKNLFRLAVEYDNPAFAAEAASALKVGARWATVGTVAEWIVAPVAVGVTAFSTTADLYAYWACRNVK